MIKITWYSISLGVYVDSYKDGTWDIRSVYTLDPKGKIYEELPAMMLANKADIEICDLVAETIDSLEPSYEEPDEYHEPEYFIRGVHC